MVLSDSIQQRSDGHDLLDYAEAWDYEPIVPDVDIADRELAELLKQDLIEVSTSEFVETSILMPDPHTRRLEPFSFAARPYLKQIYDCRASRILLKAGRQVEKTTLLGNRTLATACLIPHFRVLYVSPSSTQTKDFSKTRLKEVIETSPDLRIWFPAEMTDNVYEKKAINRSDIKLRYAFLNADRCRGLSVDEVLIDEFQDVLLDNIPVIEEAASHSPYKWFVYSGTPKSLDNPLQFYWDNYSTQNEWAVPCDRHGTPKNPGSWHWNILGEENIGANGLVCDKCGFAIHPAHPKATWVRTGDPDAKYDAFEGFRIPQLMVPWIPWTNILTKYHSYARSLFYNEVLGLSFDSGQRPLTKSDVMANCDDKYGMDAESIKKIRAELIGCHIYAGIDWGQDSSNSYTVISLGAYFRDGFFRIFAIHRFIGAESDPKQQLVKIERFIETFGVYRVGADHGGGFFPNDHLMRKYGSRVIRFQYTAPSVYMKFDTKLGRYLIHKHEVMSVFFNAIKRKSVFRFPKWAEFATPFASDMLSIFSEYDERSRMTVYKKSPNTTDDSFHSILLCFLASMIDHPREDIFIPNASVDRVALG